LCQVAEKIGGFYGFARDSFGLPAVGARDWTTSQKMSVTLRCEPLKAVFVQLLAPLTEYTPTADDGNRSHEGQAVEKRQLPDRPLVAQGWGDWDAAASLAVAFVRLAASLEKNFRIFDPLASPFSDCNGSRKKNFVRLDPSDSLM
jgi:hypothetical protein